MDYTKLSKEVSYALRHAPWEYELELNDKGWVHVEQLISSLRLNEQWENLNKHHLETMIRVSNKKRHEISQGKIRALYGHSTSKKIDKIPMMPPPILYHGTADHLIDKIMEEGIQPMGRQYVHLSIDQETAQVVGKRKALKPVILKIDAKLAWKDGITFYEGNKIVWLADYVPSKHISVG